MHFMSSLLEVKTWFDDHLVFVEQMSCFHWSAIVHKPRCRKVVTGFHTTTDPLSESSPTVHDKEDRILISASARANVDVPIILSAFDGKTFCSVNCSTDSHLSFTLTLRESGKPVADDHNLSYADPETNTWKSTKSIPAFAFRQPQSSGGTELRVFLPVRVQAPNLSSKHELVMSVLTTPNKSQCKFCASKLATSNNKVCRIFKLKPSDDTTWYGVLKLVVSNSKQHEASLTWSVLQNDQASTIEEISWSLSEFNKSAT
jgi:hypothetical protein